MGRIMLEPVKQARFSNLPEKLQNAVNKLVNMPAIKNRRGKDPALDGIIAVLDYRKKQVLDKRKWSKTKREEIALMYDKVRRDVLEINKKP